MKEFKGFRTDRLKKAMEENGATVKDIAKSLYPEVDFIEMTFACDYVKELINKDDCSVPTSEIIAVCKAVNVSADYLLGLSDEMY